MSMPRGAPAKRAARRTGLCLAALLALLPALPARAEPVLEAAILVQRHGLRAPTQSAETLERWTSRSWPGWPAGRGMLTERGAALVGLVADRLRAHYARAGLLPQTGCPGAGLLVWADGRVERTLASGQVLADRLAPGCGVSAGHGAPGAQDPVFNALGGACRIDPDAGRDAVLAATAGGTALADPAATQAIRRVETILHPDAPEGAAAAAAAAPGSFMVEAGGVHFKGPLGIAAEAAEIFLMEYAQGLEPGQVAWGLASDPAALAPLLGARARTTALGRSLPYFAARRGAGMARLMLDFLAGAPRDGAPALGPGVRLVALAGHDNNLADLAGILGLSWSLPGQPDATAPATALVLERWRSAPGGAAVVRARIWYAELGAMRALDPAGVHSLDIALPGCPDGGCPLEQLRAQITARLAPDCGH